LPRSDNIAGFLILSHIFLFVFLHGGSFQPLPQTRDSPMNVVREIKTNGRQLPVQIVRVSLMKR